MDWLNSKKVRVSLAAVAGTLIVALLGMFGIETTPEMKLKIVEIAMALIVAAGGIYTLAQGYADGKSGGITSSSPTVAPEPNADVFKAIIESFGLEVRNKRKPRTPKDNADKPEGH